MFHLEQMVLLKGVCIYASMVVTVVTDYVKWFDLILGGGGGGTVKRYMHLWW